jgi:hypothetical protein
MTETLERRFTGLDACLLAGSLALGIGWARVSCPIVVHIYVGDFGQSMLDLSPPLAFFLVGLHMASIALMPPTLVLALLGFVGPREARRSSRRTIGVAACMAASAVLLAELAYFPIRMATLYGELTRIQFNTRNNIVQYPRDYPFWPPNHTSIWSTIGAIPFDVGAHAGLAVIGVLLAFWFAKVAPTGSTWLDRLGRILGAFWVAVAVGFSVRPFHF